jgi:CubicO group peptidase (beta-lactamase class C family)
MQCLQGYVNDQCAAMLGGVSGHAGLFSNASGAAALMYMILNNGNYGGKSYIDKNIIKLFTSQIFQDNRRGLGFDRTIKSESSPTCSSASLKSFGHSGFTGTYVWADPANGLVYIFLSNRTDPEPKENKLAKMNIRTDIQQLFYNALLKQNEVKSKIFD